MNKYSSIEILRLKSISESEVEIVDFDSLYFQEAIDVLKDIYEVLVPGGTVEFSILSWNAVVADYGRGMQGESLSNLLFSKGRKSIWEEAYLAKTVFNIGFDKFWSGHLHGLPPCVVYVKALK